MKKNILLILLFVVCAATLSQAQPFYLRGSHGAPCDWGNSNSSCELLDPDMDGIYELTFDFGSTPIGRQEFKIYDAGSGWYPPFSNAWYNHQGGTVTFRYNSTTFQVEAVESNYTPALCAPGEFSGWDPNTPMVNTSGNTWCYTIANPGTYFWKPTVCGGFDSWQPVNGERSVNSANWSITTLSPNEEFCVEYDPATGRVTAQMPPTGIYLRGSHGAPCDFGNTNPACELTDPDNDGCYDLTYDFGSTPIGRQEFKIYDADNDQWNPPGPNSWYYHEGGTVDFKYCTTTGAVDAIDGFNPSICAPGEFSGWNSSEPMMDMGNGLWCYNIPVAGTYEWKPTVCGTFDSWQPDTGERSVNSGNWTVTTIVDNQQVCLTYDVNTGRVSQAAVTAVPTMGQWGFIIFSLVMLSMGMVMLRQQKLVAAGTQNVSFTIRNMPFNKAHFSKALIGTALTLAVVFAVAIGAFGYELTNADLPGSLIATPLVAYVITLLVQKERE